MMNLNKEEALKCIGGAGITASFVAAVTGLISAVYGIGQDIGYTFKRLFGKC